MATKPAGMEMPPDEWFGQQAVYRISMGNFLMFLLLAGVMAGVRDRSDKRDRLLHRGPVLVKAGVWLLFNALPFFFPNGLVNAYGALHRTRSGPCGLVRLCQPRHEPRADARCTLLPQPHLLALPLRSSWSSRW